MSPLESAVSQLQEEIDAFLWGTKQAPREGTVDWYRLHALVLGQSYLKRLDQLSLSHDHEAADRLYKNGNLHFKAAEPPAAESVTQELLPDGSLPSGSV